MADGTLVQRCLQREPCADQSSTDPRARWWTYRPGFDRRYSPPADQLAGSRDCPDRVRASTNWFHALCLVLRRTGFALEQQPQNLQHY